MPKSIGIDLGTTNSSAAIKKARAEVLSNSEGESVTPSCVTLRRSRIPLRPPQVVVGRDALEWRKQDPVNTISAVKRLMGRNFQDAEIQSILAQRKLHYRIAPHSKGTQNSIGVMVHGTEFTPEEISAEILKKLRHDAEKELGDEVGYAVITVPAYFNDKQKHATRAAAALAGLKVRRLLPEPTAAAISFGIDYVKGEDAKTIVVFDFGGGTLDLSVLTISGGQFMELGKGGDMWLGGEDIDRLVADYVLEETARAHGISDMASFIDGQEEKRKYRFLGELKAAAEDAKVCLSSESAADVEIRGILAKDGGQDVDVEVELTREKFDRLIAPVVDAAVDQVRKVLEKTQLTPDLIDHILLVGGSSKIAQVTQALKDAYGKDKVLLHERPMLAIAEGAAILSHRLCDSYECPGCGGDVAQADKTCPLCGHDLERHTVEHGVLGIVHAAAHDYMIRLEDGSLHKLIEKNTPLPCEKTETFRLVHAEQKLVHMKFYNQVDGQEQSIGDFWLGAAPREERRRRPEGPLQVDITLKIDENNLVEACAAVREFPEIRLSKALSRGKADEKLLISLEDLVNEANQKQYRTYVAQDLTYRCLSLIADIHGVIHPDTDAADAAACARASEKIDKARKMAEGGHSSRPTIWYAEAAIDGFGDLIRPATQVEIQDAVRRLEQADEQGNFEENVEALGNLMEILGEKLGAVGDLMEIQKAADLCARFDPGKSPKFSHAISAFREEIGCGDAEKAMKIVADAMPEALAVVRSHEGTAGMIHKGIAK